VWIREKPAEKENNNAAGGALSSFKLDASDPSHLTAAVTLHAAGASLYFRSPQPLAEELVSSLSADLGLNFAGLYTPSEPTSAGDIKGEIEVFLSRKGHVTDWHTVSFPDLASRTEGEICSYAHVCSRFSLLFSNCRIFKRISLFSWLVRRHGCSNAASCDTQSEARRHITKVRIALQIRTESSFDPNSLSSHS
jgi:hypothetical protein